MTSPSPDQNMIQVANQTVYFQSAEKMSMLPDESVTLVVTSPPYWNVRDYGSEQIGFGQNYQEYISALNRVWTECLRVLQPNGKICINVQPLPIASADSGFNFRVIQNIMHDIEAFFRQNNCFLSGMHYWDKAPFINTVSWGSYPRTTNIASNTSFEQIFTFVKAGKTRKVSKEIMEQSFLGKEEWRHWAVRCIWDDITPIIKINPKGENHFGHSAPFPEDIPYRLIKMHSTVGEIVVDPFLGSGTTLKLARILNRRGIGFEINHEYRNLIHDRILEEWNIPPIETGYKTLGFETLTHIIQLSIEFAQNNQTGLSQEQLFQKILDDLYTEKTITAIQKKRLLSSFKAQLGGEESLR
ncbi:MAG: site-specific DNA-methyltransferase [Promethearchaeota archaeon]|nr:MAG: site-specific DNA-methyltransferase [Candidatus Lokiarchaeota archaeon]